MRKSTETHSQTEWNQHTMLRFFDRCTAPMINQKIYTRINDSNEKHQIKFNVNDNLIVHLPRHTYTSMNIKNSI